MMYFNCFIIILCVYLYNSRVPISDCNIIGVYSYVYIDKCTKYPIEIISLRINDDGTYIYENRIGWKLEYSKGYWRFDSKKKKLFLREIIPSVDSIPIVVKEKIVEDGSIQVVFNPTFRDPIQWSMVLNDKEYLLTPDSKFLIKDINRVDSFFIKGFLNVEYMNPMPMQRYIKSITYYPQGKYNSYNISFPDSADYHIFNYVPLQDTLDFKGSNLVWNRKKWNRVIKLKKRN